MPKCSAWSIPWARAVCSSYSKCTPSSGHPKLAMYIYADVPNPLLECFQLWVGMHTWHIDQCFERLPGGVRTSRFHWNLPDVSFYIPKVISELYNRCTEHCGPPKVNRIAKVQVKYKFLKLSPNGMQAICWNLWAPDRPYHRSRALKAGLLCVQKK